MKEAFKSYTKEFHFLEGLDGDEDSMGMFKVSLEVYNEFSRKKGCPLPFGLV